MKEKKSKKESNITKNVVNKTDKELENEAIHEENISIAVLVLIIAICFLVGVGLGYVLYKLAINSSSLIIMRYLL